MEIKYWVLVGVVAVCFWLLKTLFSEWLKQQKEFRASIDEFRTMLTRHEERMKTLFNRNINIDGQLKDHEAKLSELELNQKICGNCDNRKI